MVLNGDRVTNYPTAATSPRIGISWPTGDESCAASDGNGLLTWGFAGPAFLVGCQSCHDSDGGAVLIGPRGYRVPGQEGPSLVIPIDVLSVCVMLSIGLHHSCFSFPCSDVEGECFSDRSHTLVTLIIRWHAVCLVTPLYLPLAAVADTNMGDLALVSSSSPQMVVVPWETLVPEEPTPNAREALSADGAPLGPTSVNMDGASPRPGDDAGGSLQGLVMCGSRVGVP
jgi:hypothetical protein